MVGPLSSPRSAPRRAAVFDGTLIVVGCALAVAVLVAAVGADAAARAPGPLPLAVLAPASMALTAWLCRHPIKLVGFAGAVQVALDTGVLVFLVAVWAPAPALATWLVGVGIAELVARRRLRTIRAFNLALAAVAGLGLVAAVVALRGSAPGIGPGDMVGVVAGGATYAAIDVAATAISVAWGEEESVRTALADSSLAAALLTVLSVNGMGLLLALLWSRTPWAAALALPPLAALAYMGRMGAEANSALNRAEALSEAAARCHDATTGEEIVAAVVAAARKATAAPSARLSTAPPVAGEYGARVSDRHREQWLIVGERAAAWQYGAADREALGTLAALAGQALARVAAEVALRRAAIRDPLTGVLNRAAWDERLAASVERAGAGAQGQPTVLYVDLDGFKAINDTHGHAAGDELLRVVAARLLSAVRPSDTVARLGGDEFGVLLPDAEPEPAREIRRRVRETLEAPAAVAGTLVVPRASVGAAMWSPGQSADELLVRADRAMYALKPRRQLAR